MQNMYNIVLRADRFDMNGKALCLMNMGMFVDRVPVGGKFLFRDFQLRLHRAAFFRQKADVAPSTDETLTPLQMLVATMGRYFHSVKA